MTPQIIKEEDIIEKVFVNSKYEIVPEEQANYIRIRLKDGRSIIGIKQNTAEQKFTLKMLDKQHAN